jgi:hypothetical protein
VYIFLPNDKMTNSQNKLATINIKITKSQRDWLAKTASQIRDNNDYPVPPQDRVFPQHLIGLAIDLLHSHDIDWAQIRNIDNLRKQFNV